MKLNLCIIFLIFISWGCQDVKIGYLKADNAEYDPAFMVIRKELDPIEDALRIKNETNWVGLNIVGVFGSFALYFMLLDVFISEGGVLVLFYMVLFVGGGGIMELPLYTKLPKGEYKVTLCVYNEDYSANLKDVFTFIVE